MFSLFIVTGSGKQTRYHRVGQCALPESLALKVKAWTDPVRRDSIYGDNPLLAKQKAAFALRKVKSLPKTVKARKSRHK